MATNVVPADVDRIRAAISTMAHTADRADRSLGRGLEDVSHLFLSRGADVSAHERAPSPAPDPVSSVSGVDKANVLLCRSQGVARDRIAAALWEFVGALEEGLRGIDTNVPCDPCGRIDMIACDRSNRVTIVDFETTPDDKLVLRGMDQFDWVTRNIANLQRMYPGQPVNLALPPRLFLVAPRFSALLTRVARQIVYPRIDWVRYDVVGMSGGIGILFEHVEMRAGAVSTR